MADHGLSPDHLVAIRRVLAPFAHSIDAVGLFGSRATGRARHNSDVDLVLYGDLDTAAVDRIYTLFAESLLPFTVDVQAYRLIAYPPLKQHIDDHMQPLFTQADLLNASTHHH